MDKQGFEEYLRTKGFGLVGKYSLELGEVYIAQGEAQTQIDPENGISFIPHIRTLWQIDIPGDQMFGRWLQHPHGTSQAQRVQEALEDAQNHLLAMKTGGNG